MEERILARLLFAVLMLMILASCGAQPATQEDAPREAGASEEPTSSEEGSVGEETAEPNTSRTVAVRDPEPSQNTTSNPAVGASGMVSSANPFATRAGLEVLSEGGNAFDAAVAVGAALGVAEPMMSGVGGYGAIVLYDAEEGRTWFLNTGSRTPAGLDPSAFRSSTPNYVENRCGAKAVATPGNVNAWETMWEEYGELEWRSLFDPAIELAEGGFPVGDVTAGWIEASFSYFPEHAQGIYGRGGVPLRAGETLVQEDLARSLELIGEQGAGALYEGELARTIDSTMRGYDGYLTADDLRANRARWQDTVSIDHRGYEVVTASPPATSWGTLLRLGVIGRYNLQEGDHNSVSYLHTVTEASKLAGRASRDYASDPEIASTPLGSLLSEEFFADIAAGIDPSQASPNAPFGGPFGTPTRCPPQSYQPTYAATNPPLEAQAEAQSHTTHFVVADKEGNVISSTQSLGNIFGSKVMPEGTGIWLNDALSWSRFEPPGNVFDVYPGRQSLYALCPTIVLSDGRPVIAIGTPGGRTIQQTTTQMLTNLIAFDMNIQQAISAPRVSTAPPNALVVETGIPQSVRGELAALGHNVQVDERGLGNAHGLTIEYDAQGRPARFTGGADPRGEGIAAGY
jgi:gamma-glutamyltranspeptidase/glutathione hydrolase